MNVSFLPNKLLVEHQTYFPYIILLIGLLSALIGWYAFRKINGEARYILPIFGFIFFAGGLLFWWYTHALKLEVENNVLLIEEQFGRETLRSSLPLSYFSHLELSRRVSIQNDNNRQRKNIRYEIALVRQSGLSFTLANYNSEAKTLETIKQIPRYFPKKDFYIISSEETDYQRFIKEAQALNPDLILSKAYPVKSGEAPSTPKNVQLELPQNSQMQIQDKQNGKLYAWHFRGQIASSLFFGMIVLGFAAIMYLVVIPEYGWNIINMVAAGFLSLLFLAFLSVLTMSFLGKSELLLHDKGLEQYSLIFGKKLYKQSIEWEEFAALHSDLGNQGERNLVIYTQKGEDLLRKMKQDDPATVFQNITDVLFNFGSYFISIDARPLSLSERIFLANAIEAQALKANSSQ